VIVGLGKQLMTFFADLLSFLKDRSEWTQSNDS